MKHAAHAAEVAMPSPASARGSWLAELSPARRLVATLAALAAAVLLRRWDGRYVPASLWLPAGLLVLSAALVHHRHVGAQLLARAVWWCNAVLGTLVAVSGDSKERLVGGGLSLAAGLALLASGRRTLEASDGAGRTAFAPVAFRGTLVLALVLAMADAQSLLFFGLLRLETGQHDYPVGPASLLGTGAVLALAIAGLYCLRVWGLVLGIMTSVAVIVLAATRRLDVPEPLLVALAATSAAQLVLPLPLIVAAVRGRGAAPGDGALSRRGHLAASALVLAMMSLSVLAAFVLRRRFIDF
jgi:hypothetical protein